MESYKGTIVETIFRNNDNGYTVALLESDKDIITITGIFGADMTNEAVEVFGNTVNHPKYGHQFQVDMYNTILPTSLDQIENYLSSGLIKGIGYFTAKKIVEKFKENTFNIILKHPEDLTEIEGIGQKKAQIISDSFSEQVDIKDIMMFLQQHQISTNYAVKIYKQYGKNTIKLISENPYRLTDDIYGIGFKLADKIAASLGVEKISPYRIDSGIKFILTEYAAKGHSYTPYDLLINSTSALLNVDIESIKEETRDMAFNEKIYIETINEDKVVYYVPYHVAETNVCKNLINLSLVDFNITENDIISYLDDIENKSSITLTEKQKEAVIQSVINGVVIITGGPGTGKTTIIRSIISIFEKLDKKIMLCAPTGRAAKRITESTGKEAKTIHRLLEYAFGENDNNLSFNKNEESPLESDVIIVDEMSMVDILLMNSLLKAVKKGTRTILVGDVDQLPSVGAGNVLKDIISSNTIRTIKLDKIFRQSLGSMIVQNAHNINNGILPICNKKDTDFFFMRATSNTNIMNLIKDLYSKRLPSRYGYNATKDIQILSPMKKGEVGVIEINKKLQAKINPPDKMKKEKNSGNYTFRTGDKVMQIKNNYQAQWNIESPDGSKITGEGIYNGDIGYIVFIDKTEQQLFVEFDDKKEVVYSFNQLDELILAYATTIHKSQGSEFPVIIMPIAWGPPMLLTRNLLYTAITRAKNLVVLVGFEKYLKFMVENDKIDKRYSALDYRLSSVISTYNILTKEN